MKSNTTQIRTLTLFFAASIMACSIASAQQAVNLMKTGEKNLGWTFNNGQEFPGAKGGLEIDSETKRGGQDSLKITGDFTGGGMYVSASTEVGVDVRELSFWVRNLNADQLAIRLVDSSDRCHQFRLKAES